MIDLKISFQRDDVVIATAEQSRVVMDLLIGKICKKTIDVFL
jgi:hypothetical protein